MSAPLQTSLSNSKETGHPAFLKNSTLLLMAMLFLCLPAWAQDQATLVGSVTDPTGAAIPGAKVTVTKPDVSFTRDLVTNSAGEYTAAKVPIGDYVITVEAAGFQKLIRSGITLEVGQTLRVDLQLKVGQVNQEVTVTGTAAKVETENSTISDVVTGNQIVQLNLNGRNYQALTMLTPGASPDNSWDPTHVGHGSQANISFNGNRSDYNNFEIDGGNNNDESSGGPSPDTFPNIDSIAEFRISTSNYGADVGKRSGAIIEVATKSGTKEFHGTAYEFVRNDRFDANNWFQNQQLWSGLSPSACKNGDVNVGPCNAPKTPRKWNNFGYNLGGPFYIPGHYNTDKSKTFFFWSQNWVRYREGTVISSGVPSLRMRQGDFSQCHAPKLLGRNDPGSPNYDPVAASGCTLPMNPATGLPYPGDTVSIDPNGAAILNGLIPLPNNGVVGYVAAHSVPTNYRQEHIRVDQNVSDKTSIFVRFTQDTWTQSLVPSLWAWASFDTVKTDWSIPAKSAVLHLTHSFKPNLMNEFIMAYGNDVHHINAATGPSSPAGSIFKPSTWTASALFPANAKNRLLPGVEICGGTPFCVSEDAALSNWNSSLPTFTWKDNAAYTLNKHTLKFGIFMLSAYDDAPNGAVDPQGYYSFDAGGTLTTGNALADMFLGRIHQYQEGTPVLGGTPVGGWGWGRWRHWSYEPYFQDDWKLSRKLIFNLGVRYYFYTRDHDVSHPTVDSNFYPELYNQANEAQLDANGFLIPGTGHIYTSYGNGLVQCGAGGIPVGCMNPPRNTWAPRFGIAFDPRGDGKTAIRGGYGLYYDMGTGNEGNVEGAIGDPPSTLAPSAFNINGYQKIVPGPPGPTSFTAFPHDGPRLSVQQYNVNVQHEFTGSNLLTVSYVGSQGRHLSRRPNLNQVPIGVGTMNVPVLAGTPGCGSSGKCDVQNVLLNQSAPTIFFAPYRGYGTINYVGYGASSSYNSLQVNYRHTFGYGLTFQAAYTWAHGIDDASSSYFNTGVNDADVTRWRATQDFNRTHVLVMNYIYDLPFFKNAPNSALRSSLGGWQVSGISSFFTGEPVDFSCGVSHFSSGIGEGVRCNTLGPLKIKKGTFNDPQFGPVPTWFDPNVIAQPLLSQYSANNEPGMFGYMGRNVLTGPGRNNWDIALLKNFQLPWAGGEHSTLQFRFETYNTFNHPQWKYINAGCSGATPFGAPCSGIQNNLGNGYVTGAWQPRIVQLALKFLF